MYTSVQRIMQEYKELTGHQYSGRAQPVQLVNEDDPTKWRVHFYGPKDTSYKKGLFYISIEFPEDYPNKAPNAYFLTPIYHINVNPFKPENPHDAPLGYTNIFTLNQWKPEYTVRDILTNIFGLFYMSNPDSCYGAERKEEFLNNRVLHEEKIKYFTQKYANPITQHIYHRNHDWNFDYADNNE